MTAQELAVWIASLIASPLTQLIKKKLGWSGWKALWLFFAVSCVLAFIAQVLTTELSLPAVVEDFWQIHFNGEFILLISRKLLKLLSIPSAG